MANTKTQTTTFDWDKEETHCDLEDEYIKERKDSDSACSPHSFASDNNAKMIRSPLKKKGKVKVSHRDAFIKEFGQEKTRTRRKRFQNGESSFYFRSPEKILSLTQSKLPDIKRHSETSNMSQLKPLLKEASISESDSEDCPKDSEYFLNTINECLAPSEESPESYKQEEQVMVTMGDVMPSKEPSK